MYIYIHTLLVHKSRRATTLRVVLREYSIQVGQEYVYTMYCREG